MLRFFINALPLYCSPIQLECFFFSCIEFSSERKNFPIFNSSIYNTYRHADDSTCAFHKLLIKSFNQRSVLCPLVHLFCAEKRHLSHCRFQSYRTIFLIKYTFTIYFTLLYFTLLGLGMMAILDLLTLIQ